jgi:hypothetical protein
MLFLGYLEKTHSWYQYPLQARNDVNACLYFYCYKAYVLSGFKACTDQSKTILIGAQGNQRGVNMKVFIEPLYLPLQPSSTLRTSLILLGFKEKGGSVR